MLSSDDHRPFNFTPPRYDPLPSPTSIRLLKIIGRKSRSCLNPLHHNGKLIGPPPSICGYPLIQCTLETFELADTPPYAALSYTWGSPGPDWATRGNCIDITREDYGPATKWPIAVDGQLCFIRKNLFEALQQFHPDKSAEDVDRADPDDYNKTRLINAASGGRLWEVRRLLEKGASVGAKDCFGETPLHYAAENGHYEIVKELVSAGADMGIYDKSGRTPLQCALHRDRGEYRKVRKFLWDEKFREKVLQLHHKEEEWQRLSESESEEDSSDEDDSDSDDLSDSSDDEEEPGPGERIFWIDAVCINQDDLEERAAQVKIMSEIYDKAHEVLVWLGEGLTRAWRLQAAISRVNKEDGDLDELARKWRNSLTHFIKEGLGEHEDELPEDCILAPGEIEEMAHWLTRAWFTRTWVVQELSLAQRVRMFAGPFEFCWPDVLKFLSLMARVGYFDNSTFWRLDDGIRNQDGIGGDCCEAWKLAEIRLRTRANASEWALLDSVFSHDVHSSPAHKIMKAGRLSLPVILSLCWTFQSKDPRDKIFSLLTIARPLPESDHIQIDYSIPVERLFTQVGHQFLRGSGNDAMYVDSNGNPESLEPLEGLSYVQDPYIGPRGQMPGLPTWAPDFSTPHVTTRIWRRRFSAASAATPSFNPDPDDDSILRAQVLLWDEIVAVEDLSRREDSFSIDVPPWLELILQLPEAQYPTGECKMQVLCRTLMADHLWDEDDAELQERVKASFRELLAWQLANEVEDEGLGEVCHPHDDVWNLVTAARNTADLSIKGKEDQQPGFMPTVEDINDIGKRLPAVVEENGWCSFHGPDCATYDDGSTFRSSFLRVYRKRALFRTKMGFLGLGPMYARPGDVVALVAGSRVPVIMRKARKKGKRKGHHHSDEKARRRSVDEGRYKFVGEALWYRLHVLARDLRHFRSDAAAQARLDAIVDPSYISAPYFTAAEATSVKALDVGGQTLAQLVAATLEERLDRRMKKRVESGDYRVCAAHDLAPVFEKALGVSAKDVAGDAEFEALVREKGLQLGEGEAWPGLKKRGQGGQAGGGKKNKRKNKNGRRGWLGVTRRI